MYRFVAEALPENITKNYFSLLKYSGVKSPPERFLGFVVVFGVLLGFAGMFFSGIFFGFSLLFSFLAAFAGFQMLVYVSLMLRADAKARFVESILPDVLQLMASNLRAGLTTERALLASSRPEFGPFQDDINQVGREITMGKSIIEALLKLGKKFRSQRLQKTISLIVSGLQSGGELASLLEQTARNVRQEALVDSRIKANVMMYVIFVVIALCLGAPLLFGLSSFLVEVLSKNLSSISIPEGTMSNLPFKLGKSTVPLDFILQFSVAYLVIASTLGSMLIGLISKGREREGLKYAPFIIAASLLVFYLARSSVRNLLSGIMGI
ncbi:type II secretion system F family protein [Candidatus Woesearchaeota archaeon]|nr:type II secretion system F family protein [Candidatus Woesearchaeota archaeon]